MRANMDRRVAEGKTRLEATRCLKRFLARRIWRVLTQSTRPPDQHLTNKKSINSSLCPWSQAGHGTSPEW
jgi:hypothetical protein